MRFHAKEQSRCQANHWPISAATSLRILLASLFVAWLAAGANAGGGPENVLLLVNQNSAGSKAVANKYISLRKIPASNVVYIDWTGSLDEGSALVLRDKVLKAAFEAISNRGLVAQIDYLVYSTDFPWKVNLHHVFPNAQFPPAFDGSASITGATYLAPFLYEKDPRGAPAIVMPNSNGYVPGSLDNNVAQCQELANVTTRAFRSRLKGAQLRRPPVPGPAQPYYLSTMLGVTRDRGNTVAEICAYLERALRADGRKPAGTIYYMWNKDVRSTTRDRCFDSMAAEINKLGTPHAKVERGILPDGAKDVAGMMIGAAEFDLAESQIKILPGAICEHLTSQGAIFKAGVGQTPLSDFMRLGAAGSSGTVVEPRAIQAKFPLPSLHLHYTRGCSLAEAFYQSVAGPYQLLIVGDPLCRPWARIPTVGVDGIKAGEVVRGPLTITPRGQATPGQSIGVYEIYIDGRIAARVAPGKPLTIDTTRMPDGYHDLRVVGIVADAIETQGRVIVPFTVSNKSVPLEMKILPNTRIGRQGKLQVSVRQKGATAIVIRQNSREIAHVKGEAGDVEVPAAMLGRGATTLQAASEGEAATVSIPMPVLVQ